VASFVVALHAGQQAIWHSKVPFKVCAAGRRFGKSHVAAHLLIKNAMMVKNEAGFDLMDTSVMYIAPTFDQGKRAVWNKILRLAKLAKHGGLITNFNTNEGWFDLVSGRRIYVRGADNPESLRGVGLSFVVLDEYADMKEYVWDEIIEPTLLDVEGEALFIGTPKGRNHFYKLFMNALGVGTPDDTEYNPALWSDWEAFHFKSSDNPHISQRRLKRVMERSGKTADAIRQELDADFITGGTGILDSKLFVIVDEVPGIVVRREGSGKIITDPLRGNTFLTVDPAGFNTDKRANKTLRTDETVLCLTFVSDQGDWYVLDIQHGHWDPRETARRIVRILLHNRPCRLGIEQGALSNAIAPYLEDFMKEFNVYQTPEPLKHGNTKKTLRIQWALGGRMERGQIRLLRGAWNEWLRMQADDFPSPLSHDDGLDALAYTDQMAVVTYDDDDSGGSDSSWQPMDEIAGY
jgi:hypothetical protein